MALAVGNIIQITDVQSFLSQQLLNVYFYRVVSFEAQVTLQDIAQQFETLGMAVVADVQSTSVLHSMAIVKNLSNGIDIFEEPANIPGERTTAENMPSFVALGFRLIRSSGTTRHGSKRIGGIAEEATSGNTIVAGYSTYLTNVTNFMGGHLLRTGTVDEDFDLEPVIVGRIPVGSVGAGELNLSVINPVSSAQYIRVTTQTTRRAGRGV